MSQAQAAGLGNAGGAFPASKRADAITAACRAAVAALTGGDADGVIFGPNMTALTYRSPATLAKDWRPGDEVVVSRLDHDANVRPWVQAAERPGADSALGRRSTRRPASCRPGSTASSSPTGPGWSR